MWNRLILRRMTCLGLIWLGINSNQKDYLIINDKLFHILSLSLFIIIIYGAIILYHFLICYCWVGSVFLCDCCYWCSSIHEDLRWMLAEPCGLIPSVTRYIPLIIATVSLKWVMLPNFASMEFIKQKRYSLYCNILGYN